MDETAKRDYLLTSECLSGRTRASTTSARNLVIEAKDVRKLPTRPGLYVVALCAGKPALRTRPEKRQDARPTWGDICHPLCVFLQFFSSMPVSWPCITDQPISNPIFPSSSSRTTGSPRTHFSVPLTSRWTNCWIFVRMVNVGLDASDVGFSSRIQISFELQSLCWNSWILTVDWRAAWS